MEKKLERNNANWSVLQNVYAYMQKATNRSLEKDRSAKCHVIQEVY